MEIGLTYSSTDPNHIKTRNFVRDYIREHGILARIIERDRKVQVPQITINGCCVSGDSLRRRLRSARESFPSFPDIARALEQNFWSL
ncbi:MAG: hypothetical protein P1R58_08680 [bacterium]|nr:hypothetical protein [bacterium]